VVGLEEMLPFLATHRPVPFFDEVKQHYKSKQEEKERKKKKKERMKKAREFKNKLRFNL